MEKSKKLDNSHPNSEQYTLKNETNSTFYTHTPTLNFTHKAARIFLRVKISALTLIEYAADSIAWPKASWAQIN